MKKFLIISIVLILISAGVFGYSTYHYIDVTKVDEATPDEAPTKTLETIAETESTVSSGDIDIPDGYNDNGIFSANYEKAYKKVSEMTNEQLVGTLIMGTCKSNSDSSYDDITKYNLSSYWLSSDCFSNKTEDQIKEMVKKYKERQPGFIVAVDEEGGQNTTVTDHDAYIQYSFDAIGDLYKDGGLSSVEKMEKDKVSVLKDAGVSLNLAPVVDLAKEEGQIMYSQSLRADANDTSKYAEDITKMYQDGGISACLRHFPGYGTTVRSDDGTVTDERKKSELEKSDFLPFKSGISANCHFIMVGNYIVKDIDNSHIASLSTAVNKILKDDLSYTGIIITDNLDNDDYSQYADGHSQYVEAILAGNDMIIVDNIGGAYDDILNAVNDGTISKEVIEKAAMRVIAYKYTAKLMK